jgi:hypothetical protein
VERFQDLTFLVDLVSNLNRSEFMHVPKKELPRECDRHLPKKEQGGSTPKWRPSKEKIEKKL